MGQSVQQGAGQPLRSESLGPFVERQVAGDQRGAALVAPAEDFKQQFGSCPLRIPNLALIGSCLSLVATCASQESDP